jgi:23S rRNA (guanosine2251-2'-O)-methyltransferase
MRLYGKRSIIERFNSNPRSVKKLYFEEEAILPEIAALAKEHRIQIQTLGHRRFLQLAQKARSQGVIAEVDNFYYRDFDEMIDVADAQKPTLIILDRINDPQNLGVILRNCACLGGFCIVLPKHESVEVTEAVLRVASGAENYIPVCQVSNLSVCVDKARKNGYWIGATVVEGGQHPHEAQLNFPLALIFGSEGEGIRQGLTKHLDYKLTLPMHGAGLSFNVAMAVAIFSYEASCQRPEGRPIFQSGAAPETKGEDVPKQ